MPKMTEQQIIESSDEEILDAYDYARGLVSHYNAADSGAAWFQETNERNHAKQYLKRIRNELDVRGLEGRSGTYLL